jgi:outer membrane scaffolding protein for murein synthesis (MipA/OmpV family)
MRCLLIGLLFAPLTAAALDDDVQFIGAAVYSHPKFDGSPAQHNDPIPQVHYVNRSWFVRTTEGILEGGMRWGFGQSAAAGVQVAYEDGPLGKHPGASLGVHAELDGKVGPAPISSVFRLRQFLSNGNGWEADARVNVGVYEGHGLAAAVYGQGTWANEKIFNNFYAVSNSGLLFSALGVWGGYMITPKWLLLFSSEGRRLGDAAASSPYVERRSGFYGSLGLAYRL